MPSSKRHRLIRNRHHSTEASSWDEPKRTTRIPRWIPLRLHHPLRYAWRLTLVLSLVSLATLLFYLCLSFRYNLSEVASMPERTVVLDAKGRELSAIHGQNRRLISDITIPKFFIQALQAREDARFFEHHGVDYRGVARATLRNIRDRSFTQGASTLTMQLVRNTYDLWDSSLHRKLLEIALSWRVEAYYSKNEILTHYLNRIYLGSGSHGLEEASLTYFGVSSSELNRNQCALLAGVIRAPHTFSPLRNLEGAERQHDDVLQRMITEGMITPEDYDIIRAEPLSLNTKRAHRSSHAVRAARRHFDEILVDSERREGGLIIHSTIQREQQDRLESCLEKITPILAKETQLGAICIEAKTGSICAVVGGRDNVAGNFNRALDIRRDIGSIFSLFLHAISYERHQAVTTDKNPLQAGRQLGRAETTRFLKRLGLTGRTAKNDDDLYRGSIAASPLQVATAASTLINDGQRPRTYFIDHILDSQKDAFFRHHPSSTPVLGKETARSILQKQSSPFITSGFSPGRRDYWILALGTDHAFCLWLGHDASKKLTLTETQQIQLLDAFAPLFPQL